MHPFSLSLSSGARVHLFALRSARNPFAIAEKKSVNRRTTRRSLEVQILLRIRKKKTPQLCSEKKGVFCKNVQLARGSEDKTARAQSGDGDRGLRARHSTRS